MTCSSSPRSTLKRTVSASGTAAACRKLGPWRAINSNNAGACRPYLDVLASNAFMASSASYTWAAVKESSTPTMPWTKAVMESRPELA